MKCANCGEKIKKNYNVCPNCGERVETPEQEKSPLKYYKIIIGLLLAALIFFVAWLIVPNLFKPDIEELKKSVVQIYVYDINDEIIATGSGVVAFENDVIITNAHVVEENYKLEVISENNTKYQVEGIIGYNKKKDIAILKLSDSKKLKALDTKDSLAVGDDVIAIGSPLGLKNTVSNGILSGYFQDAIKVYQHTAPISPGSSGGALFDARGRLVGITYASIDGGQNINFAIPIKQVEKEYNIVKDNKCIETEYCKYLNNGILKTKEGSRLLDYALNDEYGNWKEDGDRYIYNPQTKEWTHLGILQYSSLSNENWWFGEGYNQIQKYVGASLYMTSGDHGYGRIDENGNIHANEQDYYTVIVIELKKYSSDAKKKIGKYFEEYFVGDNLEEDENYDIQYTENYAYCILYKNYDNISKVKDVMRKFP